MIGDFLQYVFGHLWTLALLVVFLIAARRVFVPQLRKMLRGGHR